MLLFNKIYEKCKSVKNCDFMLSGTPEIIQQINVRIALNSAEGEINFCD